MGVGGFHEASLVFQGSTNPAALQAGALNLVRDCAQIIAGQRVLILAEDPSLGWFDREAPLAVAGAARMSGADANLMQVGGPGAPLPAEVIEAQRKADAEIWFARIGDQDRFAPADPNRIKVVSYARTAAALASTYGTRPHADMMAMRDRVDAALASAETIRITCPNGTNLSGASLAEGTADVTVRRFPMCMPCPVPAKRFSGQVALSGFLTPTGSRVYDPPSIALSGLTMAEIKNGRIAGFDGPSDTVARIEQHYAHVSALFGIDPGVVHSWHAGLHSGCVFNRLAAENPDLWANSVFGHPDWLHFHTCGDYAPGEICWMVQSPTITADGQALWQDGELTQTVTGV